MAAQRVMVVGGGLAGMAAAVALQSAGVNVTLIEARKSLGGRAGSFEDPATGEILDNCQHVLLGCCTNLLDLYKRLGVEGRIHWESAIRFVDAQGKSHRLWGVEQFPAPLHLALAGTTFSSLTLVERWQLARAMLALLRLGRDGRDEWADKSFGQWLAEQHQPDALIDKFYELVLVSALNEESRRSAGSYAMQVFQESLLFNNTAYRMGTPACALAKLYENLPCADVRLGTRLTGLRFTDARAVGVEIGQEFLEADAVILATSYFALDKFIPPGLYARDTRLANLQKLESVPILGAHLWFDRPVLSTPHAAFLAGPLQWLFRKHDGDGSIVHGVISAARAWVQRTRDHCFEEFQKQIIQTLPEAKGAKLLRGTLVVEKRATFSPSPGVDRLRPSQSPPPGGIAGLFLAGDYTLTGWPATMEGAVRSGYLAAEAVLQSPGKFFVKDLPLDSLARRLGGLGGKA